MVNTIKYKGADDDWLCDACGEERPAKDWELVMGDDDFKGLKPNPDALFLVCPECHGAMVFSYSYHVHWNPTADKK
jgi:hypothetical protein